MKSISDSILSGKSRAIKATKLDVTRPLIVEWLKSNNLYDHCRIESDGSITYLKNDYKNNLDIYYSSQTELPKYIQFNPISCGLNIIVLGKVTSFRGLPSSVGSLYFNNISSSIKFPSLNIEINAEHADSLNFIRSTSIHNKNKYLIFKDSNIHIKSSSNHITTFNIGSSRLDGVNIEGDIDYLTICSDKLYIEFNNNINNLDNDDNNLLYNIHTTISKIANKQFRFIKDISNIKNIRILGRQSLFIIKDNHLLEGIWKISDTDPYRGYEDI